MKLLFYLSKKRSNKGNLAPIYCRVTIDKERCEISTGIFVAPQFFEKGFVCNNHPQQDVYNAKINYMNSKLNALHLDLLFKGVEVTPGVLKSSFLYRPPKPKKFTDVMGELNAEVFESEATVSTKFSYKIRTKNLIEFLVKNNLQNMVCDDFDFKNLQKLEYFLHHTKKFKINYTNKHLFFVGQILKKGMQLDVATKNSVHFYKKQKDVEIPIIALTKDQLTKLEQYRFASFRLQNVADLYIFQCYTGLAYTDLCAFDTNKHLHTLDNKIWIRENRAKTNCEALLPLFNKAREILDKYNNKLPIITNQKYNAYLKEINDILGFDKYLTTHTARKTFAMIKLNEEGMSIESVARMLGHNSTRTTQKTYSRVTHVRINNEVNQLGLR